MSDLPLCPAVLPLSTQIYRNAAIAVCEFVDYERAASEECLLALGLIEINGDHLVARSDADGNVWCTSQASRANA